MATKTFTLSNQFDIADYTDKLEKNDNVSLKNLGKGIDYDGFTDVSININPGVGLNLLTNFSVEVWVKPYTDAVGMKDIVGKVQGNAGYTNVQWRLARSGTTFYFYVYSDAGNNAVVSTSGYLKDQWHHIICSITTDNKLRIRVDNDTAVEANKTVAIYDDATINLTFGRRGDTGGLYWYGLIDNVRIFNVAMSSGDEDTLWASGAGVTGPDPLEDGSCVGLWDMDENTEATLNDGVGSVDLTHSDDSSWVEGKIKRYAGDSPQAKFIDVGETYSFDAGAGSKMTASAFSATEVVEGTATIKYRYAKNNIGDYPTEWSDWMSEAEFDTACANGQVGGNRFLFVQAQFNSDTTDDATLNDATFTYSVEVVVDYDEVAIAGEGSASQTFSWKPDYMIPVIEKFEGERQGFEAGYVQTFPKFRKTRRTFDLRFMARDETEKDNILAFINSRVGSEEAFYFQPEDETANIKVCAIKDKVRVTKVSPDVYNISLDFEEIY